MDLVAAAVSGEVFLDPSIPKEQLNGVSNMDIEASSNSLSNWHTRWRMRNGKPRPSAIRDYPDIVSVVKENGVLKSETGNDASKLDHKPLEQQKPSKSEEENDFSEKDGPDHKANKDSGNVDTASSPEKNGGDGIPSNHIEALDLDNQKNEESENLKQAKIKVQQAKGKSQVGDFPSPKVLPKQSNEKAPRPKPAVVRDLPDMVKKNVEQKKGISSSKLQDAEPQTEQVVAKSKSGPKESTPLDTVKLNDTSKKSKRSQGGESEPEQEVGKSNSTVKESVSADTIKPNDNGKKAKRVPEETKAMNKAQKGPKTSGVVQPSPKGKKQEADSQAQSQEKDVTPKATKRKSKASTPLESAKKVRRSADKKANKAATENISSSSVREALRLFDATRRKLVQDEEKMGKHVKGRADLTGMSMLKDKGFGQGEKMKGSIPGVEVGDAFFFRSEISFIKMHAPLQGGIEYLTAKETEWNIPVAINIISNVGQDGGNDSGEQLIYAGQGGRSADNKQTDDQKLERGNLAMDGSRRFKVPVRVIRGIKDINSFSGKIYIYDGLYTVEETYTVKGSGGFDEYRFRLERIPGQPQLGSYWVTLANELKSQSPSSRKDVVVKDISKGKESQPVCVANTVDEDKGPASFEYTMVMVYPDDIGKLKPLSGCNCKGPCGADCSCLTMNGDECPYITGGILVKEKGVVYECGRLCACPSNCHNRGPQKGSKFRLEVFKTQDRGWGLRSLETIPAGSFVCEYTGKLIVGQDAMSRVQEKEHILDVRRLPSTVPRWGDVSSTFPDSTSSSAMPEIKKAEYVIDASQTGNVARFINHSCMPNLLPQKVLYEHEDTRFCQIKFFSMDIIPPMRELTFDYGPPATEELSKDCLCGSSDCRGKM